MGNNAQYTYGEFYWLSEILEKIADKMQNKEFIIALRKQLVTVTPETYTNNTFISEHLKENVDYAEYANSINMEINYAEEYIN